MGVACERVWWEWLVRKSGEWLVRESGGCGVIKYEEFGFYMITLPEELGHFSDVFQSHLAASGQ